MTHSSDDKPSDPRILEPPDPALSPSTTGPLETFNPDPAPATPIEKCLTIQGTQICIRTFCTADEINGFTFDPQFGMHAQYKSIYTKKETLQANAVEKNANVTLALDDKNIIGFGVLNHPEAGERWLELGDGLMMEVKAIEVCRRYRSLGLAAQILEMLVTPPQIRDKIIYMVGYSWTWDLDGTGHSALAYRNMLIRLFEPFEFQEMQTNEPNICLKPENLFMARVGQGVSEENRKKFKWLRFGIT